MTQVVNNSLQSKKTKMLQLNRNAVPQKNKIWTLAGAIQSR